MTKHQQTLVFPDSLQDAMKKQWNAMRYQLQWQTWFSIDLSRSLSMLLSFSFVMDSGWLEILQYLLMSGFPSSTWKDKMDTFWIITLTIIMLNILWFLSIFKMSWSDVYCLIMVIWAYLSNCSSLYTLPCLKIGRWGRSSGTASTVPCTTRSGSVWLEYGTGSARWPCGRAVRTRGCRDPTKPRPPPPVIRDSAQLPDTHNLHNCYRYQ